MGWVAFEGDWDEDNPEPDETYWCEPADNFEAARLAMLRRISEFVASDIADHGPCLDCLAAAGEELASLARAVPDRAWRGFIDGGDYVVARSPDEP